MAGWFGNLNLGTIASQVSDLTQSIGEEASRIGHGIQEKVNTLTTFDFQDIGEAIKGVQDGIVAEEAKIKAEDTLGRRSNVKILPWETRLEHKAILSHALMEKVLALSLEESNFTTAPPSVIQTSVVERQEDGHGDRARPLTDSDGTFQLEGYVNVAVRMLSLDPNLAKIHSRLIASIPENTFWRNYFQRIGALRADVGLEPLCEDLSEESRVPSEEPEGLSHGDAQSSKSASAPSQQVTGASDEGGADDDYSDLGDLDDLGDSDSNIDATLEAEIAAELRDN